MPVQRIDYDNPAIDGAANPTIFGYHHGPVPHANPGFNPRPPRPDGTPGTGTVTPAMNESAPNPGTRLSSVNSGVCFVAVDASNEMCGVVANSQPALRRHIRDAHPGAVANPDRRNTTHEETRGGKLALKLYVRSGAWRTDRFAVEPKRGAVGEIGLIDQFASDMEALAASDPAFAAAYGTQFHRERAHEKKQRRVRKRKSKPSGSPEDGVGICAEGTSSMLSESGRDAIPTDEPSSPLSPPPDKPSPPPEFEPELPKTEPPAPTDRRQTLRVRHKSSPGSIN